MDNTLKNQLQYLGFYTLVENWDVIMKEAGHTSPSYHRFLTQIVEKEYTAKAERARLARIKRAKIPEIFVMETFPFHKQPRLKKKLVLELYDSLIFMKEKQNLIFIGPTGCGKTGLATAFLVHAINQGFRGLFIDFSDLLDTLYQSRGDYSEGKLMKKYLAYDVILIDELGYISSKKEQASLFFDLMRHRHQCRTTIITTQLLCGAPHNNCNAEFIVMRSSLFANSANVLFWSILTPHKRAVPQRGDQFVCGLEPSRAQFWSYNRF